MDADIVVNNELESRQPHTVVRDLRKIKRKLWVADVHHDFEANLWHDTATNFFNFGFD